jgi:hypothetical protein
MVPTEDTSVNTPIEFGGVQGGGADARAGVRAVHGFFFYMYYQCVLWYYFSTIVHTQAAKGQLSHSQMHDSCMIGSILRAVD